MAEINLLDLYPHSKRPIEERGKKILAGAGQIAIKDEELDNTDIFLEHKMLTIARRFGKEYFDGDRLYGYGGYYYDPRFWTDTVKKFSEHYKLTEKSSVLDVGCAKGFMLYDFKKLLPQLTVAGIDISQYAHDNAIEEIKPFITVGNAKKLPYDDNSFDVVISINTIDHLPQEECKQALSEIQRVAKRNAFISVNAWRNEEEKERMAKWNVTALTCMHIDDWKKLFSDVEYTGDYWWFIAD
ncbi:MAG: class I SAM-dependent methyltransferase [Sedimentisphaerales bacterium]|nr:class I SAM-dependent methyltransferase [Sedimentisphaerales bacterium]